jgi:hypothetical protein
MTDPAIYRKYAQECLGLATMAPKNARRLLLDHAGVWLYSWPRRLNVKKIQDLVINKYKKRRPSCRRRVT